MLTWLAIVVRHLRRNRRRSLATLLIVSFGSAGVGVLGGFTRFVFQTLEDAFINARGNGQIQLVRRGSPRGEAPRSAIHLLGRDEQRAIREIAARVPEVVLTTGQLTVSGLISNGSETAIFGGIARVPADYRRFRAGARGFLREAPLFSGRELGDDRSGGIGVSSGLGARLGLRSGSPAVVLAATLDGRMNAQDSEVVQFFEASAEPLNDKMVNLPLAFAQDLVGTEGVDAVNVLLRRNEDTDRVRGVLERELRQAGVPVEVRTWFVSYPDYLKNLEMFGVIFGFVLSVVLVIVVLSVLNTVGMAVLERTREIGTLRALGLRRRGVVALFAAEGGLLGVAGTLAGSLLAVLVRAGLRASGISWSPPVYTGSIPLDFLLVPEHLIGNVFLFTGLAMLAAVLPARRAARISIPAALDHV